MSSSSSDELHEIECARSMQGHIRCVNVVWTLEEFNRTIEKQAESKVSAKHYVRELNEDSKFRLKLSKISNSQENIIQISFSPSQPNEFVRSVLYTKRRGCRYLLDVKDYEWAQRGKWTLLTEKPKQEVLSKMHNNRLILDFEFLIKSESDGAPPILRWTSVDRDLENIMIHSPLADVKVVSSEGVELQAHRVILCYRCPFFKAAFEHDTIENSTNVVQSSFDTEVLQNILQYIYTDTVPKIREIPEKLLEAADFYQLDVLKTLTQIELIKLLNTENIPQMLEIADKYSAELLRRYTLKLKYDGTLRYNNVNMDSYEESQMTKFYSAMYK